MQGTAELAAVARGIELPNGTQLAPAAGGAAQPVSAGAFSVTRPKPMLARVPPSPTKSLVEKKVPEANGTVFSHCSW